jgi:hypothetical protein
VLHWASSDHVGAATAIKQGMERGNGGYWIHTSGTDILLNPKILHGEKDKAEEVSEVKVYDDWDNIKDVISFPGKNILPLSIHLMQYQMIICSQDAHSHRPCDKIPLSLSTSQQIKTAIICPPTIWGRGRGTGSTRSHQIYAIASLTLERGSGILIHPSGAPKTFWPNIHLYDLARLYLEIVDSAATELEGGKGEATWGKEGYYFAENGVHYWHDVSSWVAEEAYKQGYLQSGSLSARQSDEKELLKLVGPAVWNLGASCKAIRAKKLFGWDSREKELKEEIAEIVRSEAERAGITRGLLKPHHLSPLV